MLGILVFVGYSLYKSGKRHWQPKGLQRRTIPRTATLMSGPGNRNQEAECGSCWRLRDQTVK